MPMYIIEIATDISKDGWQESVSRTGLMADNKASAIKYAKDKLKEVRRAHKSKCEVRLYERTDIIK